MPNTDFGSNVRSPGGWGGTSGNSAMGGIGSQKASQYNYNQMGANKIGNFNTGGARVGTGNQFGLNRDTGMASGPWPGGYATPVMQKPIVNPVVAALAKRPAVTKEELPGVFTPTVTTAPQGVPGENGYYDMREALGYNPFAGVYPANPGGQFGPRTYNDGYQTVRADKFQNNPAYGSPGGGLGQYNNQSTVHKNNQGTGFSRVSKNGGFGGSQFSSGGPR